MPGADRKLKICWAVVIYIAAALAVCSTTTDTCHAPSHYGPENKVTCNVSYTDTLVLECPDPASQKAALWMRVVNKSSSAVVCNAEGPKCTLNANRRLTNQDSGIYFCRVPTTNGSNYHQFYVEVNTLAPPSLLGVVYCDKYNSSSCTYPALMGNIREDFKMTVSWNGIGPFSVQLKHNDSDFDCQLPYCEEKSSSNEMSLVFLAKPHPDGFPGVYSANISNTYGWNMSHTDIIVDRCQDVDHPIILSHNSSRALTDGSGVNLTSSLIYTSSAWLTVCYGKFNQSLRDFTNNSINDQYCTFCPPSESGDCGSLPQKPDWEVYRQEEGLCKETLENVIAIRNFAEKDEGKIFCFYGDDEDPYELYTTHTLTYVHYDKPTYTLYIVIGVVCTCVVMLLIMVAVCIIWRKKKCKSQDSGSPSVIVDETHSWRGPRLYGGRNCTRGERAPLLIPRSPATLDGSGSSSGSSYVATLDSSGSSSGSGYGSNGSRTQAETDWPEQVQSDFLPDVERNGPNDTV